MDTNMKELELDELGMASGGAIRTTIDGERVLNEAKISEMAFKCRNLGMSVEAALAMILEKIGGGLKLDNREQAKKDIDCRIQKLVENSFRG